MYVNKPLRKPMLIRLYQRTIDVWFPGLQWQLYWKAPFGWHFSETWEPADETGPALGTKTVCIGPLQMQWYLS